MGASEMLMQHSDGTGVKDKKEYNTRIIYKNAINHK
jgi:hypothetical protein